MSGISEAYDLIVIGGGPAGMAAAVAAKGRGLRRVLLIEREGYLGGVLPQCVHDGFGLHLFDQSFTGPEYASIWEALVHDSGIEVCLQATVFSIEHGLSGRYLIDVVGITLGGRNILEARSVIVSTGCHERTRGQLIIPGTRPAGVLTAGAAQYMINIKNQLPGDRVVILGSGDIGLIMARRLTLEGAEVRMVLGQDATGLLRNHIRCIQDFDIPIRYGWGLVSISGRGQLKGVTVAPLNKDGSFDIAHKQYIYCNVLLLACGLIPEREVLGEVNEGDQGIFLSGNANYPMDLIDQVTKSSIITGVACADYVAATFGSVRLQSLPEALNRMYGVDVEEPIGSLSALLESDLDDLDGFGSTLVVCTICPTGCAMKVSQKGVVEGNICDRGKEYALSEMERPLRVFTGTVKTVDEPGHLVPVKTSTEVPRESLMRIAKACKKIKASLNLSCGDVVCADVAGTGADLVLTAAADKSYQDSSRDLSWSGLSIDEAVNG